MTGATKSQGPPGGAIGGRHLAGFCRVLLMVAGPLILAAPRQVAAAPSWAEVKCSRYATVWRQYVARGGTRELGAEFLARHATFLASGCQGDHDVCPRSPREIEAANDLTVLAMNQGTASTFPPFGCKR